MIYLYCKDTNISHLEGIYYEKNNTQTFIFPRISRVFRIFRVKYDPIFFLNFAFFGCFAYFWWFKLGLTEDERLIADRYKAGSISFRICFSIAFLLSLFIGQFSLDFELLYKIQLIILSLTFAISVNLWAYLTYKFDLED